MTDKQELVVQLLSERLPEAKVGIIFKGIAGISPEDIVRRLSKDSGEHLYMAAVGYDGIIEKDEEDYSITPYVEKAVLWRSIPQYAGSIIVFVLNDTDKLHSLAEFENLSARDLTRFLIELQIKNESNTPTLNFWKALQQTADYYSFDVVYEFVDAVTASAKVSDAIPVNMWRLNLLCDKDILGTKSKPEERLAKNRELIFAIGQLSEDSRKKLSRSLVRTKGKDKERLQNAYTTLQNLYKYGKKSTLQELDYDTVQELFSASKATENKKKKDETNSDPEGNEDDSKDSTPIRSKELGMLVSDAIVSGDDESLGNVKELLGEIKKHFDPETDENDDSIPTIGGIFEDRNIVIDNHQSDLRKLVGRVCNETAWGGLLETEETVLKDAISADIKSFDAFDLIIPVMIEDLQLEPRRTDSRQRTDALVSDPMTLAKTDLPIGIGIFRRDRGNQPPFPHRFALGDILLDHHTPYQRQVDRIRNHSIGLPGIGNLILPVFHNGSLKRQRHKIPSADLRRKLMQACDILRRKKPAVVRSDIEKKVRAAPYGRLIHADQLLRRFDRLRIEVIKPAVAQPAVPLRCKKHRLFFPEPVNGLGVEIAGIHVSVLVADAVDVGIVQPENQDIRLKVTNFPHNPVGIIPVLAGESAVQPQIIDRPVSSVQKLRHLSDKIFVVSRLI